MWPTRFPRDHANGWRDSTFFVLACIAAVFHFPFQGTRDQIEGTPMQLEIHGQNLRVDDQIQGHIERQMEFALGQFDSWITGVTVHLEDINGPRGGVDKRCRALVTIKHGKTLRVEDDDVDFTAAINRVADRLRQAVGREVDKRRDKKANGKS